MLVNIFTGITRLLFCIASITLLNNVDRNIPRKDPSSFHSYKNLPMTTIVSQDGSQIELSDNQKYEIAPQDRTITKGWIGTEDPILLIMHNPEEEYPLILINTRTKAKVRGKYLFDQQNQPSNNQMKKENSPKMLERHPSSQSQATQK